MTYSDLSRETGIPLVRISRAIHGHRRLGPDSARKLAEASGLPAKVWQFAELNRAELDARFRCYRSGTESQRSAILRIQTLMRDAGLTEVRLEDAAPAAPKVVDEGGDW